MSDDAAPSAELREEATHERRNWVRLTFGCNNRCRFCLDAAGQDGGLRDRAEVARQILDGRRAGASRLVLSGGEPTLHPAFVDFVRLGRRAGYRRIQTVTNGRMFAYPEFLRRALDAGLGEITFSVHGPDAATHDELVGVPGAYEQTLRGLRQALGDGRPVVNVDVVLTRANVGVLSDILGGLTALGVREFELLWAVPFGRAFGEGRALLLDADCLPAFARVLSEARRSGVTLWLSRIPPELLEGHEELIPDPYKLLDEVRGRAPEIVRLLREGVELDCRDAERCRRCALGSWCAALAETCERLRGRSYRALRFDTAWEAEQQPVYGVDPASERRALGAAPERDRRRPVEPILLEELGRAPELETLIVAAPDLEQARAALGRLPRLARLELELGDWRGLRAALAHGELDRRALVRAVVAMPDDAEALLALPEPFEVVVLLSRDTAGWLLAQQPPAPRLAVRQPCHDRRSAAARHDVELGRFFAALPVSVPVEGVPACLARREPRPRALTLELGIFDPAGRIDPFRFTRHYLREQAFTKSLRCQPCRHHPGCAGLHLQHVRAFGYGVLSPVREAGP